MDILDKGEKWLRIGNIEELIPPSPGLVADKLGLPTPSDLPTPKQVADDILPRSF